MGTTKMGDFPLDDYVPKEKNHEPNRRRTRDEKDEKKRGIAISDRAQWIGTSPERPEEVPVNPKSINQKKRLRTRRWAKKICELCE